MKLRCAKPAIAAAALAIALTSCGSSGGADTTGAVGDGGLGTSVSSVDSTAPDATAASSTTTAVPSTGAVDTGDLGILTLSEYLWITEEIAAVFDLKLPEVEKRRVLSGAHAWRHPSGNIVFTEGCGVRITRIAVAAPAGGVEAVSPCSSEVPNPGASPTRFDFARSSPDETRFAVEAAWFLDDRFNFSTAIIEDSEVAQIFDGHWAPTWLDNDTVMLAGAGLFLATVGGEPKRIDDGSLDSGTNNPDIDPAGERVAFEWNQQIWMMNIDGSGLEELVSGPSHYRFPAWAPDGNSIAFLATSFEARYDLAIYFLDIESREFFTVDISDKIGDAQVPLGPLSWTDYGG